jgi:hypothetical protein
MSSVRVLLPDRTNDELHQLVTSAHFLECVDKVHADRAAAAAAASRKPPSAPSAPPPPVATAPVPLPPAVAATAAVGASVAAAVPASDSKITVLPPPSAVGSLSRASNVLLVGKSMMIRPDGMVDMTITPQEFRRRVVARMEHQTLLAHVRKDQPKWHARRMHTVSMSLTSIASYDVHVANKQAAAAQAHAANMHSGAATKRRGKTTATTTTKKSAASSTTKRKAAATEDDSAEESLESEEETTASSAPTSDFDSPKLKQAPKVPAKKAKMAAPLVAPTVKKRSRPKHPALSPPRRDELVPVPVSVPVPVIRSTSASAASTRTRARK